MAQWRDRQLAGIVIRIKRLLRAVFINLLPKIALLIKQPDADHRNTKIAGRFHLIARYISEAARVDGQSFAQHKLHAEIGDASQGLVSVVFLKPRGCLRRLPAGIDQPIDSLSKSRVAQHFPDLVAGCCLQDDPWVIRKVPQFGIQQPPNFVGRVVPRPSQIQSELRQRIESINSGCLVNIGRRDWPSLLAHELNGLPHKKTGAAARLPNASGHDRGIAHWC